MTRSSREKQASNPPMGPTPELRDPYHPDSPIDPAVVQDKPTSVLTNVRPVTVKPEPEMNKTCSLLYNIALASMVKEALVPEAMALGTLMAGAGAYKNYSPRVTLQEMEENVDPMGTLGGPSPRQVLGHKLWRGAQAGLPTAALGGLLAGHPLGLLTGAPAFARGMSQGEEEMAQALLDHAEGSRDHMRKKLQKGPRIRSLDED